jgi:large subunit ribosomal protein L10
MSLSLTEKKAVVEQVSKALAGAQAAIVAEYRGLTVAKMTELRREARDAGVYLKVVKNTLARRALKDSGFECLDQHFVGPLALAASEDPVAVAKVLSRFQKDNDVFAIKAGAMSGNELSHD